VPGQHAVLSPSASERWLSCPASVQLSLRVPKGRSSSYAEEGTTAHSLGEIEASFAFGQITKRQYTIRKNKWLAHAELAEYDIIEMERHVNDYVSFIQEKAKETGENAVIFLEQRMNTGIESCWGTGDCVIVTPTRVTVIDLKYGAGVAVDAMNNSQLRLYGCGALDTFGDMLGDTEEVETVIFQPRVGDGGSITSEVLSAEELRAWREEIRPKASEALAGSDVFNPSEKNCRWCPASALCRERVVQATSADFSSDPDLLSPEEVAEYLSQLDTIRDWCSKIEDWALNAMYSEGAEIPGYKVVMSGGRRAITDKTKAIELLVGAGFTEEQVTRKDTITLGDMEKLVGKAKLPEILGDTLKKSDGKPSIAQISDARPAISPTSGAAEDFAEELI